MQLARDVYKNGNAASCHRSARDGAATFPHLAVISF